MSESEMPVRPIAVSWLLDRVESLVESAQVGVIGEASRDALIEEAMRDVGRARTQIDAAVEVMIGLAKTIRDLDLDVDDDWMPDAVFVLELLTDEFGEGELRDE